jgi:hypothetical protein
MVMRPAGASHPRLRGHVPGLLCYIRGVTAFRRHLQRLSWIALVAIFGLALAPTLSHALHADDASNPFAEICSAAGAKAVPVAAGDVPAAAGGQHLAHCPLCAQASGVLGMPPALASFTPPDEQSPAQPPTRAWAVPVWRSRRSAQPRAPPVVA